MPLDNQISFICKSFLFRLDIHPFFRTPISSQCFDGTGLAPDQESHAFESQSSSYIMNDSCFAAFASTILLESLLVKSASPSVKSVPCYVGLSCDELSSKIVCMTDKAAYIGTPQIT